MSMAASKWSDRNGECRYHQGRNPSGFSQGRGNDGRRARLRCRSGQARRIAHRRPRRGVDRFSRHGLPPRARVQDQDSARPDHRECARRYARGRVRAERCIDRSRPRPAQELSLRDSGRAVRQPDEGRRHPAAVHAGDLLQAGDPGAAGSAAGGLRSKDFQHRMNDHFAAFAFVDRIIDLEPGMRARGTFAVPGNLAAFPACLVAEAVGQLAAWVAMSKIDFRGRPVAALATETIFHGDVAPGSRLALSVEIEALDDEAVVYGGSARVDDATVIELRHCLGPMLPVQEFDAPEALRERFRLLCATGAPAGRFRGVATPELVALEVSTDKSARALLQVPRSAPFFADHFPRRPVFPATLLLDSQIRLAMDLARAAIGSARKGALVR